MWKSGKEARGDAARDMKDIVIKDTRPITGK